MSQGATVIAGGTDHYPARVGRALTDDLVDITGIAALRGIEERADHWRIGATTTWTDIVRADLPPHFAALRLAGREVGGQQIQNAGTIAGNLCNASPAADGVPALMALDAEVELMSEGADAPARMPVSDFILGNRKTARRPDQIVTAIRLPKPASERSASHFLKLGARRYLVISIVMVAARLLIGGDGRVAAARVVVGACAPKALRLPQLEAALIGRAPSRRLGAVAEAAHLAPLVPIDDVRASADYRNDAALGLVRRCLDELGAGI